MNLACRFGAVLLGSALMFAPPTSDTSPPPSPQASATHDMASSQGNSLLFHVKASVFELQLSSTPEFFTKADELRASVAEDWEFETALSEFGDVRRVANVDRIVDLKKGLNISLGSSVPGARPTHRNSDGVSQTVVSYQEEGTTLNLERADRPAGADLLVAEWSLQLSLTNPTKVELADGVPAPAFTKWKSSGTTQFRIGRPEITIDFANSSESLTPRAIVTRYLFEPITASR